MNSGWIIHLTDGECFIVSERKYRDLSLFLNKRKHLKIEKEEHWFDLQEAIDKYPWLPVHL